MFLVLQQSPCSAGILSTKGSVQPPYLAITITQPPRRVRSLSTQAAVGATTTLSRGKPAWTCAQKVCKPEPGGKGAWAYVSQLIVKSLSEDDNFRRIF